MKLAKYISLIACLVGVNVGLLSAQTFQATMTAQGATLSVKAKVIGGNVTTGFANMEFYIRYPSSKTITWGTPMANTTNFPGIVIQKNDPYTTVTETGYTIVRFFLPPGTFGTSKAFTLGTEYEVFNVSATQTSSVGIEMMHQDAENPYVLTMVNEGASSELTNSVKFYGTGASTGGTTQSLPLTLAAVVPLELIDFAAKAEDKINKLAWQTASEFNTSHFSIEKQANGRGKFSTIGEIKASGYSSTPQYYAFSDAQPTTLDYYRLKMVDFDGQFTYSKTVAVARQSDKNSVRSYPSPANNVLNIELVAKNYRSATIDIVDATGKTMANQQSDNANNRLFTFNIHHFQSGIYTALINVDGVQTMHKVVVAK